jgi:hypothetical protein
MPRRDCGSSRRSGSSPERSDRRLDHGWARLLISQRNGAPPAWPNPDGDAVQDAGQPEPESLLVVAVVGLADHPGEVRKLSTVDNLLDATPNHTTRSPAADRER